MRHTVGGRGITDKRLDGSNERSSAPSPERAVAFTLVPTFLYDTGATAAMYVLGRDTGSDDGTGSAGTNGEIGDERLPTVQLGSFLARDGSAGPRSGLTPTARTPASSSVSGAPASRTHSASLRRGSRRPAASRRLWSIQWASSTGFGRLADRSSNHGSAQRRFPQRRGRTCSGSTRRAGREVWCGASSLTPSNPLRRGFG